MLLFTAINNLINAQQGGEKTYAFLDISAAPRVASIGGSFLPVNDDDIFLGFHNSSLINENMHNHLGLSFLNYFADITAGNVVYSRTFEKYGSFIGGVQFMHYGDFVRTDAQGNESGNFSASDVALTIGWGRSLHPGFTIGADVKWIFSDYDTYTSIGISTDVSSTYTNESGRFVSSLLVRNIGRQLTGYTQTNKESLPFAIEGGVSYKLEHAPFRFFFLLNDLQRWDLSYDDPLNPRNTIDPLTGEPVVQKKHVTFTDNLFRHFIAGTEFSAGNFLKLRVGYNYQLRKEMGVQSAMGMVGFSWGIGLKLGRYHIDFSRVRSHIGNAPTYFSLRTYFGDPKTTKLSSD